jgi:6-phosphogluconolactonase
MTARPDIRIFATHEELFAAAAAEFQAAANVAIQQNGRFTVALAGGSTPKGLYSLLASQQSSIAWQNIYFFFGDERHVPPDHPDSNYKMAYDSLLSKAPVPPDHIFRVKAENSNPETAASDYEATLKQFFALKGEQIPRLDLVLLGMGPDGHTASLFPGSRALYERHHLVVANWVEKFQTYRITFTLPLLTTAANVTFLVTGADKAAAINAVFDEKSRPEDFPAKLVRPSEGKLLWLLDEAAAGSMKSGEKQ